MWPNPQETAERKKGNLLKKGNLIFWAICDRKYVRDAFGVVLTFTVLVQQNTNFFLKISHNLFGNSGSAS